MLLSQKCHSVTILQDIPRLNGEQALQDRIHSRENISVLTNVRIESLKQENDKLTGVVIKENGSQRTLLCDGLFVAIGLVPDNEAFSDLALLNSWGYFDSGEDCTTKTPGVFVAGDCRNKTVRQLTTAVGDGAMASMAACRYLDSLIQE